jgi:hypothetical protein
MIYIANSAASADREARYVVDALTAPLLVNFFMMHWFRGTIEEYKTAISIWNASDEAARRAVVDALGLKLYWLIEQNVSTDWALYGPDGDERYYRAVCNALADIVRDTKIIYQWRQYKLDWHQYKLDWHKKGIEIRGSDFMRWGTIWEQSRLKWERRMLENAHPATREALAWHEAASALQKLVDYEKKDPMVRDYPDVDLPEFELTPSWVYLPEAAE